MPLECLSGMQIASCRNVILAQFKTRNFCAHRTGCMRRVWIALGLVGFLIGAAEPGLAQVIEDDTALSAQPVGSGFLIFEPPALTNLQARSELTRWVHEASKSIEWRDEWLSTREQDGFASANASKTDPTRVVVRGMQPGVAPRRCAACRGLPDPVELERRFYHVAFVTRDERRT